MGSPSWHRRHRRLGSAARRRIHPGAACLEPETFVSRPDTVPSRGTTWAAARRNGDERTPGRTQGFEEATIAEDPGSGMDLGQRGSAPPARYDWTHVPEQARDLSMETDLPESRRRWSKLRRAMLKGLHAAKKADGRVRRLKKDISKRKAQFVQFVVADLKMQYLEEQKRFEADVKRLEAEVEPTNIRSRGSRRRGGRVEMAATGLQVAPGLRPRPPCMAQRARSVPYLPSPSARKTEHPAGLSPGKNEDLEPKPYGILNPTALGPKP